jgi:hypothetical protein
MWNPIQINLRPEIRFSRHECYYPLSHENHFTIEIVHRSDPLQSSHALSPPHYYRIGQWIHHIYHTLALCHRGSAARKLTLFLTLTSLSAQCDISPLWELQSWLRVRKPWWKWSFPCWSFLKVCLRRLACFVYSPKFSNAEIWSHWQEQSTCPLTFEWY